MRTILVFIAIVGLLAASGLAGKPATTVGVDCNWGHVVVTAKGQGHSVANLQTACEFMQELAGPGAPGPSVTSVSIKCNWGKLTMAITPLGEHASDPSGDGRGPEKRVGLANLIERGNMHATCDFLSGLPPP